MVEKELLSFYREYDCFFLDLIQLFKLVSLSFALILFMFILVDGSISVQSTHSATQVWPSIWGYYQNEGVKKIFLLFSFYTVFAWALESLIIIIKED